MTEHVETYWRLKMKDLKESLELNGFEVFLAENKEAASNQSLKKIIPETGAKSISWGGSETFTDSGLFQALKDNERYDIINTFDKNVPPEEVAENRRKALLSDLFITGTNAITEEGQLVNLDMIGNRVGAITFGPKHVLIMAGRNKIVPDLWSAMDRIKNYAAPVNAMRLKKKTPCEKTGVCADCGSPERICNSWTITEKSFPKKRIKVLLINEELGI